MGGTLDRIPFLGLFTQPKFEPIPSTASLIVANGNIQDYLR